MRKHRTLAMSSGMLLLLALVGVGSAQGTFEDADKSNEFSSSSSDSQQHFDLRHTIPGEPGVDYPIHSKVPKTSFECTGKHEGYYADVESRCQAFRICAHTARSIHGFGFLCPNGTLFSQKHFVCDWYRNVRCDDSERFFAMNSVNRNRVGSNFDMMETVRQMKEYPMRTVSQALQRSSASSSPSMTAAQRSAGYGGVQRAPAMTQQRGTDEAAAFGSGSGSGRRTTARKSAVTRAQVESVHGSQTEPLYGGGSSAEQAGAAATVEDASEADEVYVNSLGELSTDPGVKFVRTNAHIIAEHPRPQRKKLNFAEKVNAGLDDLTEQSAGGAGGSDRDTPLAPDYVKAMQTSSVATDVDLAANINGLLNEIATDASAGFSGYQLQAPPKPKNGFKFLSRGFSSQSERSHDPYAYVKPKQTASTIRFTPNELPIEHHKDSKHDSQNTHDEAIEFTFMTTTTTTTPSPSTTTTTTTTTTPTTAATPSLSPLSAPLVESSSRDGAAAEPEIHSAQSVAPIFAALIALTTAAAPAANSSALVQPLTDAQLDSLQELDSAVWQQNRDKNDVNEHAAGLLLAGVQLTMLDNGTALHAAAEGVDVGGNSLLIHVTDDPLSFATAESTTIVAVTPPITSTEAVTTEAAQERVRSFRRFATLQRNTTKPLAVYGKRANVRAIAKVTTTAAPATAKTTRSYLKRVAASRLRLSRLTGVGRAGGATTPTSSVASTLEAAQAADNTGRQLSVRNIDSETAIVNDLSSGDTGAKRGGKPTWETVHSNLQRYQVKRTRPPTTTTTTASTAPAAKSASKAPLRGSGAGQRKVVRFNKFKKIVTPSTNNNNNNNNNKSTSPSSTVVSTTRQPAPAATPLAVDAASATGLTNSQSLTLPPLLTPANTNTYNTPAIHNLNFLSAVGAPGDGSVPPAAAVAVAPPPTPDHLSPDSESSSSYLSFEKLTRAIVDESILQNFRSTQHRHSGAYYDPSATIAPPAAASQEQSPAFGYGKLPAPAAAQLTPPPRPHYVPAVVVPTTPRIVIARAEGQLIESNSINAAQQQQLQSNAKSTAPYVPLDDFISRKFGSNAQAKYSTAVSTSTSSLSSSSSLMHGGLSYQKEKATTPQQQHLNYIKQQYQPQQHHHQQQPQQQQHNQQQQQQHQPLQPQAQQQKHFNYYQAQGSPQQQQQLSYQQHQPQHQQQQHQQQQQPQQQQQQQRPQQQQQQQRPQQSFMTQSIFANFQQNQHQLPQFPPLSAAQAQQFSAAQGKYLNVPLPALPAGLIPAPTTQVAQKRIDIEPLDPQLLPLAEQPQYSDYAGVSSYDVPLSSIGRLSNDIIQQLRRLRRYK